MKNSARKIWDERKGMLLAILLALAAAGMLLFAFSRGGGKEGGDGAGRVPARPGRAVRASARGGAESSAGMIGGGGTAAAEPGARKTDKKARRDQAARKAAPGEKRPMYDFVDSLPENLKATAREMVRARDDGDEKGIVEPARVLLASGIPEARLEAAEALGDAGWHGFQDTAGLLLDADEDVADAARDAWQMQMSDLDDKTKGQMMKTVAETVANADSEYLEGVLNDYWVENDDRDVLDFLVPLYAKTENVPSKKVILDLVDSIILPENTSKTLEDALPAIEEWYRDNPPDDSDEDDKDEDEGQGKEQEQGQEQGQGAPLPPGAGAPDARQQPPAQQPPMQQPPAQ